MKDGTNSKNNKKKERKKERKKEILELTYVGSFINVMSL
jgi:hypothetical protein